MRLMSVENKFKITKSSWSTQIKEHFNTKTEDAACSSLTLRVFQMCKISPPSRLHFSYFPLHHFPLPFCYSLASVFCKVINSPTLAFLFSIAFSHSAFEFLGIMSLSKNVPYYSLSSFSSIFDHLYLPVPDFAFFLGPSSTSQDYLLFLLVGSWSWFSQDIISLDFPLVSAWEEHVSVSFFFSFFMISMKSMSSSFLTYKLPLDVHYILHQPLLAYLHSFYESTHCPVVLQVYFNTYVPLWQHTQSSWLAFRSNTCESVNIYLCILTLFMRSGVFKLASEQLSLETNMHGSQNHLNFFLK